MKKVTHEFHKKENGVIVSGGISKDGLGKLIFHSWNINTFAYKQVLQFYKEDINNLGIKIFQQDGTRAHSSKGSQNDIKKLFGDYFIPIWDNGPKMNGEYIQKWPPNFPDLSAIELVWSIIKEMIHIFPPTNMEELKSLIRRIWYSIPKDICERIKNI